MNGLDLAYPRKIDFSLPGNERCGMCPDNMPEGMKGLCKDSAQG